MDTPPDQSLNPSPPSAGDTMLLTLSKVYACAMCGILKDVAGIDAVPDMSSAHLGMFESPYTVTVFSPFFGRVSGHFILSLGPSSVATLCRLGKDAMVQPLSRAVRGSVSDVLKEILNVSAGRSLYEFESALGGLSSLPPTTVFGHVDLPDVHTVSIVLSGADEPFICALSLNRASLRIAVDLECAQSKLRSVHESQNQLLRRAVDYPAARFSACYHPLHEAGGDFYDVVDLGAGKYGYFVADMAGHDISAGFLMASVRALVRQNCTPEFTPMESLIAINRVLRGLLREFEYMTACFAVLDRDALMLTVFSLSHPPVLLLPRTGEPWFVDADGSLLGAYDNIEVEPARIKVAQGDRFVLYTDGLVESTAQRVWVSSKNSLLQHGPELLAADLAAVPDILYGKYFGTQSPPTDDVVVLCVEV
jgi:hypothetical protein